MEMNDSNILYSKNLIKIKWELKMYNHANKGEI